MNPLMRADAGIARLSAFVANFYRTINSRTTVDPATLINPSDLMPWTEKEEQFATEEDMKRMFRITD